MDRFKKHIPWLILLGALAYMANPGCEPRLAETVHMIEVTEGTFESEVEQATGWVLVDFWATWCPPCRRLMPILDEAAADYAGQVKFVKVDADDHPQLAERFNVKSLPHVFLFRDGRPVTAFMGYRNRDQFRAWLDEQIGESK